MKNNVRNSIGIALAMMLFSGSSFGQVISYGTSDNFALFTTTGAFNNTGTSVITGDIGTNAGAFTGFPPGVFSGQSHVADAASLIAVNDVANAYGLLSATTCGPVLGVTLGNNQTLTPNIYCIGAATSLNGDLILDGQGNSNSVFIIKIDGAFATSTNTNVILTNLTSLCNVIWQVNGAFTLGANSVFRGNIVANGAITLGAGTTLIGRCISNTGAININSTTVRLPTSINMVTPPENTTVCANLPASFSVVASGADLTYQWRKGNVNLTNTTNISGVTGSTLTFASVTAGDTASDYNVVVYGDCTPMISNNVSLELCLSTQLNSINRNKSMTITSSNHQTTVTLNNSDDIGSSELKIYNLLGKEVMSSLLVDKVTIIQKNRLGKGIFLYKLIGSNSLLQSGKLVSNN
ncbi:MAG: ice-binding family protein [Bacteroidales bacterium]